MKTAHCIAFVLVIVGGLNWLLVGLFSWDIGMIFGGQDVILSKIIYILVGLSAIYLIITHKNDCNHCVSKPMTPSEIKPL
jgi:hypothetical protein